ncbi:MAG: hypothetical protein OJJ21_00270 [Ferrovibrio sp.]|uniref:hypothetical protein n=1 Tax=Ferrovibrio sp. TaxID=1917215 RepID=UPI00261B66B8|nr:hypothetical protein [Ferrovibrio sp.]MCW0232013.1 hypothetical protein [Ferrovibrio sp.]
MANNDSAKTDTTPAQSSGGAEFVTPPNYLKMKVGAGGIDKEAVKEAEIAIQVLGHKMYAKWADDDLGRMRASFEELKQTNLDDAGSVKKMLRICWDMKGLGGTFGYPLVTTITHYLSNYLEHCLNSDPPQVSTAVVSPHIDALYVVLSQKISGDGGAIGRELVAGLEKVVLKTGARIGG